MTNFFVGSHRHRVVSSETMSQECDGQEGKWLKLVPALSFGFKPYCHGDNERSECLQKTYKNNERGRSRQPHRHEMSNPTVPTDCRPSGAAVVD
ncbi:hypothetical protein J6590_067886 [Homalodisca vitripennis]|nr:hypothetical protein J6590_067886 [Homalodisca vitripennis]